jgi:hypothetical protein
MYNIRGTIFSIRNHFLEELKLILLATVCRGRRSFLRTGGGSMPNAVKDQEDPWLKVMILNIFIRWRKSVLGFL